MIGRIAVALALGMGLIAARAAPPSPPGGPPRSGYQDASPETRAMQDDDAANPAFLWVRQGETLWAQPAGTSGKSCASCHGDAATGMRGVAARYPAFDRTLGRPVTLEQRINLCRANRQQAPGLSWDSGELLGLSAYVGLQSRGLPLRVNVEGLMEPFLESGRALFNLRQGQLNLSCAQCHDGLAGRRLAGSVIPQGHPNGYPEYRLEWQGVGSFYRRLRNCLTGVRAALFPPDAPEVAALELFMAWRAKGLPIETPAVRPRRSRRGVLTAKATRRRSRLSWKDPRQTNTAGRVLAKRVRASGRSALP
jgi:L-cysteine S-thiosulfotransferase